MSYIALVRSESDSCSLININPGNISRISMNGGGGHQTTIWQFCAKNEMKMKNFWQRSGGGGGSATESPSRLFTIVQLHIFTCN